MVEFRFKDLEAFGQPASVDLVLRANDLGLSSTSVVFYEDTIIFQRTAPDEKPRRFSLSAEAFQQAIEAYRQYCQEKEALVHAEKEHRLALHQDALKLAESVQFDLDTLNVRIAEPSWPEGEWIIQIPAIAYTRFVSLEELIQAVQTAFEYLKKEVEEAEAESRATPEWRKIIASYRRQFPNSQAPEQYALPE